MGVYYWMSLKHLHRYLAEYCGRYNTSDESALDRIGAVFHRMRGKRLTYRELVGD